jgi:electron-transferring-flavoprotein dehydrogenase
MPALTALLYMLAHCTAPYRTHYTLYTQVWQIPAEKCKPGLVQHTLGWPLQRSLFDTTYGGSFLYHMAPDLVLLGLVVGLDYPNPHLNPYKEFQRWKHHPAIASHIEGGQCVAYGARALNEGGYHALPKMAFPGGALLGCAAGTLNAVKIKGAHTAMKSGMLAAEGVYAALSSSSSSSSSSDTVSDSGDAPATVDLDQRLADSWVGKELKEVRNCHASFHKGVLPGLAYTGLSAHVLKGREPWTLHGAGVPDSQTTQPAKDFKPIEYPRPDGVLSFDLLTNLQRSGTNHEHDQPSHLRVRKGMESVPAAVSYAQYAGPEQRFCPAGVYEYEVPDDSESSSSEAKLIINAQNCVHCKTCAIKTPAEYIDWTVPEGGGGPNYTLM